MRREGPGPQPRGALPEEESDGGNEFFDVSATIVDPEAGKRAVAAIAAARGFGQNESPTKESKNVSAALAEHERNLAEERRVSERDTPTFGFDLRVDALQEIEPPAPPPRPAPPAPTARSFEELEPSDKFDIQVATGSAPSPMRPRGSNGFVLVLLAVLAGVGGFTAFRLGAAKLVAKRASAVAAPSP